MESESHTPQGGLSRSSSMMLGGDLPSWIPDHQHHCRNCGWCICSACSPYNVTLPHLATTVPQRVCNDCFENLRQVAQLRQRAAMVPAMVSEGSLILREDLMESADVEEASTEDGVTGVDSMPPPAITPTLEQQAAPAAQRIASTPLLATAATAAIATTPTPAYQDPYPSPSPTPTPGPTMVSPSRMRAPSPLSSPVTIVAPPTPLPAPTLTRATSPQPSVGSAAVAGAQLQMLPLTIPPWTYIFKPFSGTEGAEVSVGRLGVTVLSAADLPSLDTLFNTPSPYVQVRLGSTKKRTHTLSSANAAAASSPDWSVPSGQGNNSADGNGTNFLLLDVSNVLEILHVELWEAHALGKDVLVATAQVPLPQLAKPEHAVSAPPGINGDKTRHYRVDAWLPLKLAPIVSSVGGKLSAQALSAVSTLFNPLEWAAMTPAARAKKAQEVRARKEAELRRSKKGTIPPPSLLPAGEKPCPRIHVELSYSYSKMGEFWSHFTPPPHAQKHSSASATGLDAGERRRKRALAREARARRLARIEMRRNRAAAAGGIAEVEDLEDEEPGVDEEGADEEDDAEDGDELASRMEEEDAQWEAVKQPYTAGTLEPFRLQTSYDLLRRTLVLLSPLYTFIHTLSDCFSPGASLLRWLVLSLSLLVLAWNPSFIPVLVLGALLRYVLWNYLYRVKCGGYPQVLDAEWQNVMARSSTGASGTSTSAAAAGQGKRNVLASALSLVNPLNLVTPFFKKNDASAAGAPSVEEHPDVLTLERMLLPLLHHTLLVLGCSASDSASTGGSTLDIMQAQWARAVDAVQAIREAMEWSRGPVVGRSVALGLSGALLYCCFFSPKWIMAITLSFFFCRATVLGGHLEWLLLSTGAAISESKIYQRYVEAAGKTKQA